MSLRLAYLSQGKLFYVNGGPSAELVSSTFGQEMINRALQRQQKNEWKAGGEQANGVYNRSSLWGVGNEDPALMKVAMSAVTRGSKDNELVYVLTTEAVGGMFAYDIETKRETRLFHKEGLYLHDLSRNSDGDMMICSQRYPNSTASISLCRGNDVQQVTEGDSVDEAPSWVPGKKEIVYQSAGVARNGTGYWAGVGPASIQRLNLENGEMTTLAESEQFDFLSPRVTADGDLFYIKRPYETMQKRNYPLHKMLLDVVLFPFRLARAFFHFLNFFSMAFSRKPLTTASGPKVEGPDQKTLMLRGRVIDAEEALAKQGQTEEAPGLVPPTWQLICRKANGEEKVLTSSVLSYDLAADGSVVYTNGTGIFQIAPDGTGKKMLCKSNVVENVVVL
jgi:hypothetical protein